jgi:hypothetical protein
VIFALLPVGALVQKFVFAILLLYVLVQQNLKIYFPKGLKAYFFALILLSSYSFISSYWLHESLVVAFLVAQKYLFLILCFIVACQICYALSVQRNQIFLKRIVIFLVSTQFVFVVVKFLILGKIDEGFLIGSMHHNARQLGFLFPALMLPIIFFLFYPEKFLLTLALVLLLLVFGVLNEKRSVFYLGLPIIFGCLYALRSKNIKLSDMLKLFGIVLFSLGLLSFFSDKIGSLSGTEGAVKIVSENRIGFLFSYAIEYLTMDYDSILQGSESLAIFDTNVQVGRFIVWVKGLDLMFSSNILNQLFGYGFGYITPSEYINEADTMFSKLGFRGAISSALEIYIEAGIIGLTLLSYLFLSPFVHLFRKRRAIKKEIGKDSLEYKTTSLLIIGLLVFVFDFYLYSNILFSTLPLPLLFFMMLYTIHIPFSRAPNGVRKFQRT